MGKTSVQSMNLGMSIAYRFNDHLSIGGGVDVIYGVGDLYRDIDVNVGASVGGAPVGNLVLKENALDVHATGVGLGANIGMVYEVNER